MNRFRYARAGSLEDAGRKIRAGALPKAGGVDLLQGMRRGTRAPDLLVDLVALEDLKGLSRVEGGFRLGAMTRLSEIVEAEILPPGLVEAASGAATPQIRNMATLAGNLLQGQRCWYLQDPEIPCRAKGAEGCPALEGRNENHAILGRRDCPAVNGSNLAPILSALDAVLELAEPGGRRTELPVRKLYDAEAPPGLTRTALPREALVLSLRIPDRGLATAHVEFRRKESFDWAVATAAVALRLEGGKIREPRIWLGALAPVPWRAGAAETFLAGSAPGPGGFARAVGAALQGARPLREGGFKLAMARQVLLRALEKAAERAKEAGG